MLLNRGVDADGVPRQDSLFRYLLVRRFVTIEQLLVGERCKVERLEVFRWVEVLDAGRRVRLLALLEADEQAVGRARAVVAQQV